MHEMSIAESLIEQIISVAKENSIVCVDEVEIETGYLKQIIPDVMQEAFKAVIKGTIAENAVLKITEISALAKCNLCKEEFTPELDNFLCPKCIKADVVTLKGDDIILKAVIGKEEKP
ncbi:MAG: hydrogenase maturation nickel metallochaperone HypA [Candidatus Aceula meridiana]|nr:hydrogenase maturation nickel metallochaperone HypA [Candidatus Aceula meridiana]